MGSSGGVSLGASPDGRSCWGSIFGLAWVDWWWIVGDRLFRLRSLVSSSALVGFGVVLGRRCGTAAVTRLQVELGSSWWFEMGRGGGFGRLGSLLGRALLFRGWVDSKLVVLLCYVSGQWFFGGGRRGCSGVGCWWLVAAAAWSIAWSLAVLYDGPRLLGLGLGQFRGTWVFSCPSLFLGSLLSLFCED